MNLLLAGLCHFFTYPGRNVTKVITYLLCYNSVRFLSYVIKNLSGNRKSDIYMGNRMRRNSRPSPKAFTLIEMLSVVAVISVVLALAVPAFQSLGQASALSSAGNTTANLISAARQNSVSRNVLTAFVLLTGTGTDADYRAMGLFERGVNSGWEQVGKWEVLPTGIAVQPDDLPNCSFLTESPLRPTLTNGNGETAIVYQGRPLSAEQFAFRVFLPTGSLSNPDKPAQLRLVEGTIQGLADARTIQLARNHQTGDLKRKNYYDIAIVGTTGAPKINRQ